MESLSSAISKCWLCATSAIATSVSTFTLAGAGNADHLILDMGDGHDAWARRCLQLADRVLLITPHTPSETQIGTLGSALDSCPAGVKRTLVVLHPSGAEPRGVADRFAGLSCDGLVNVVDGSLPDIERVARVVSGRANVLVIGGGGARGFAHIGAYRALQELGIPIDIVAGTSIGGVIGTMIADGHSPEELVTITSEAFADVLDYTYPSVSLIKGERITKAARSRFGSRQIEDLRKTFVGVSTDLTTSRPHLHVSGDIVTAIRATCAIPGVMPPVPMGDALLVDGGVLNNLPMDVARNMAPAGHVIAFDVAPVHGPRAYNDYGLSVSGWRALRARRGRKRSPYPRINLSAPPVHDHRVEAGTGPPGGRQPRRLLHQPRHQRRLDARFLEPRCNCRPRIRRSHAFTRVLGWLNGRVHWLTTLDQLGAICS